MGNNINNDAKPFLSVNIENLIQLEHLIRIIDGPIR
jgi:hypothetical protein